MNNGKKITNTIVAVVLFSTVMWQSPSNAMVWPSTDIVQISSILNNISNGFTKVASVGMQLKNYNATIHAIGDQMNVVAKYAKDINKTMDSIKSNVDKITTSTTKAINDTSKVVKNLKDKTDDASVENKQLADNTVAEVEASISTPEANNNMKAALETGQKDTERNNQETKQAIQQTKTTVKNLTDNTRFALNGLTDIIVNKGELENDVKADLQKEAKKIDNQIIDYNIHADKIISEIEDENNSNNEKVSDAYDKYGQKVDAFSNKSITQKELIEAGQEFKKDMASIPTVSSQEKVKTLTKEGEEITNSMQNLKEKILDNIANNKDYSDEDTDKTSAVFLEKKVNFAYNNHSEHKHIFMKGIYAKDISLDCGNAHNSFMLSYELKTDNGACSKQNFEDIKDPQKINQFMDALRDCVVRAKAEVEYICPEKNDFSQCDIYEIEPKFKEYQEKGVYQHILEDYNVASITNNMQCRQYVSSWLDIEENKSTLKVLMTQMQNVKNIRDAYALQTLIDLEAPQLWSYLRRVDSIQRAKDVINEYRVQPTLHIDERDDDFTKAQKQNLGKNILSNVILYKCDMNGNDVSVAPDDNDKEEKPDKQKRISKSVL